MVLPLKDSPAAKQTEELGVFPFFSDILVNMEDDDYWHRIGSLLQLDKVEVPALHIAGWYDPDMTPGVLASYQELKEKGGSELARTKQRLLIGPWIHSADMSNMVGDLDFGMASSGAVADITGVQIRWFDYWLKGIDNGMANESPVRIFVMGENVWRDEDEWPLTRTKYIKYYFHSSGRANSLLGDGILNSDAPDNEQSDSYLYDPRNPAPSDKMMGAWDQQEVEKRADVLVYSSLPLETDLEVTGSVDVNIYAISSAIDTDFTGKLIDVWPDGKAYNVAVGIVRARFRQSVLKPDLIKPGVVYEYTISLSATSNVFKAGHRIRIEISSSYFPKWDRNLNTGHPIGQDDEIERAIQTIHHSKQYPSNIVLPVIPR
jgi:putative CocE/NonD family hydrolase